MLPNVLIQKVGFYLRKSIFLAVLAIFVLPGCNLHEDSPLDANLQSFSIVERPAVACGPSTIVNMVESVGVPMGSVEFVNDSQFEYVIFGFDHDWGVLNYQIYAGSAAGIPKNSGQLQHEAFPYKMTFAQPENQASYKIPVGSLATCNTFCIRAKIAKMDMFGNVIQTSVVWMNGTSMLNGFRGDVCRTLCIPPISNVSPMH